MSEQMERDAREIGAILRNELNMRPAAAPELDREGFMRVQYVPPPAYGDLNLRDMGKQTLSC